MAKVFERAASRPDEDNPEWTAEHFARARPAAKLLSTFIGEEATRELLRRSPGRPVQEKRKVNQTLRVLRKNMPVGS